MLVISVFSGTGGEQSSGLSLRVTEGIVEVIDAINVFHSFTEEESDDLTEALHGPVRKLAHMAEYAVLFMLLAVPMMITFRGKDIRKIFIAAIIICICYASVDEIHQLFTEGREGKITDVMIDTVGALFGLVIVFCINKFAHRKIESKCEK